MKRRLVIASTVVVVLVIGAPLGWYAYRADPLLSALEGSERVELLALDPRLVDVATLPEGHVHFHGYLVLGRADVESTGARDRIIELVHRDVRFGGNALAMCFNPRHGLSITKDGHVTDLVICFECFQIEVFVDGAKQDRRLTSGLFAEEVTDFYESRGLAIATEEH